MSVIDYPTPGTHFTNGLSVASQFNIANSTDPVAYNTRWQWNLTGTESGANAGSNLQLQGIADDGYTVTATAISINRATGAVTISSGVSTLEKFGDGTVAAPSIASASNTGTGFYFTSTGNVLNVAINGTNVGNFSSAGLTTATTLGTTNPATTRNVFGKLTLNYAGNVTISGGTGSVAGTRGEITGASGTTLKDGFYYGAQGKFTLGGATIDQTSAARFCGVIAQLDVSSGTMTNGQLSALWADMGATAAGAFAAETNVIRATNTTSQAVNSILYGYGKATYAADLSDNGGGWASTTGSSSSGAGALKVYINGAVRYIQLYSDAPV